MKKYLLMILALSLVILTVACGNTTEDSSNETAATIPTFKIGAIPDQDVSDLARRFDSFSEYLGTETGLTIEYVPSQDYSALVTAFNRGEIQLAWFGGLTGVQARNIVDGAEAIAQRPRDEEFHSVFIAQKSLNISTLADLKDKSFTFGSESSTSGHLMPRFFMMEADLIPEDTLSDDPNYSGSHDKTIKLVASGAFDAGALNEAVWEKALESASIDTSVVDVFYTTPAYYDYNWTINNVDDTYGEGTSASVKAALLNMNEEHADILELFHTDKFIESNNNNYKAIKDVAIQLGIIKE